MQSSAEIHRNYKILHFLRRWQDNKLLVPQLLLYFKFNDFFIYNLYFVFSKCVGGIPNKVIVIILKRSDLSDLMGKSKVTARGTTMVHWDFTCIPARYWPNRLCSDGGRRTLVCGRLGAPDMWGWIPTRHTIMGTSCDDCTLLSLSPRHRLAIIWVFISHNRLLFYSKTLYIYSFNLLVDIFWRKTSVHLYRTKLYSSNCCLYT